LIIARPNGAGKTTFAREFLPNYADCKNFVNADLIAQGMAPFSPETAAFRAGKMMLSEIQSLPSGVCPLPSKQRFPAEAIWVCFND
jgi:predicted ABC-type ATPase